MRRAIHPLMAVAATLALASCEMLSSSSPTSTDAYFPLAVGNEWTYSVSQSFGNQADTAYQETWTVAGIDSTWYRIDRSRSAWSSYLRYEEGALVEGHLRFHDQYTVLPSALHEGASWHNGWGCILTFVPVFAAKAQIYLYEVVDAAAHVSVPAGVFANALRVRIRLLETMDAPERDVWYAPGVGVVKERLWSPADVGEMMIRELESYSMHPTTD